MLICLYDGILILVCLKMIYTCTLYPIQSWELAKNEGHIASLNFRDFTLETIPYRYLFMF